MGIREQLHDTLDEQGFPTPTLLADAMSRLDARQPTSTHRWQAIVTACLAFAVVATFLVVRAHRETPNPVGNAPASCPVTLPPQPQFVPPASYPSTPPGGESWYGTPALWTSLAPNGTWRSLPYTNGAYTQKVFWWRDAYDWRSESGILQLSVSGVRIDGPAKPLIASTATSASGTDIGSAMLVLIDIPAAGCWEITGQYQGTTLSFVVWVTT
jgi:hypothetical protein